MTPLADVPGSGKGWTGSQIANEAINSEKIAPGGVTSGDLADSAVTRSKIAPGLLADWAVVANDGSKTRSEPSGITSTKIGAGTYAVTFPAVIDQCASQVSIASPGNQPPTPLNDGVISAFAQSAVTIEVRTHSVQVSPPVLQDRPFHISVNC